MEITLCDISAFQYWRIPPIVKLLAVAPEDDSTLRRLLTAAELYELRNSMAQRLALCRLSFADGAKWRKTGEVSQIVRDASMLLAPNLKPPADVLVDSPNEMHHSTAIKTHIWGGDLISGSTSSITDELSVTSPAFTLQQLAAKCSLTRTVLMASEMCGTFAVYRAPEPIRGTLQSLYNRGVSLSYGGWSPGVTPAGKLTALWQREPLVDVHELISQAELSDSNRGRKRLLRAAELVHPGAASPFEVQVGILLGFPRRLGGEELDDFEHNKLIELSGTAKILAGKQRCYGDLVWDEGLDIECQSTTHHDSGHSYLKDSERITALELMGYHVLPITYGQLSDSRRWDAVVDAVCSVLGRERKPKTAKLQAAASKLRSEVLVGWAELPFA